MDRFVAYGLAAAWLILILAAGPVAAEDAAASTPVPLAPSSEESTEPEELQALVGDFTLAQEDEALPTCPIRLTDQQSIGGWQIEMPETWPAPYPSAD